MEDTSRSQPISTQIQEIAEHLNSLGQQSYAPIGVSPDGFPFWSKETEPRNLVSELFTQGSVGGRQVTAASTRQADMKELTFRSQGLVVFVALGGWVFSHTST